jgi:hypothetical protein
VTASSASDFGKLIAEVGQRWSSLLILQYI